MAERLSNLGYALFGKEPTPGTAVTPSTSVLLYDQTLMTQLNMVDLDPIAQNKAATYTTIPGQRDHKGDFTIAAEPNTTAIVADMLLTKTSTSGGAGVFTHLFQPTGDSNSYTVDFSTGNVVMRFMGVKASKLAQNWNKTELQWKVSVSALGSFLGRSLAGTPTGTGTFTVALDTVYDPNPTNGLVMGDLIRFYKKTDGSTIDATVTTIVDGQHITTSTDVSTLGAGDMVYLRPAVVANSFLPSFIWPKTQFQFASTAATALTATQVRVETGSLIDMTHSFENDSGAMRSGGFDPAALVRTTADASLTVKKFFDKPDDIQAMQKTAQGAAVVRMLAGTTNQYEARLTLNAVVVDGIPATLKTKGITYSELKYHIDYNQTDGQNYSFLVTNALPTI